MKISPHLRKNLWRYIPEAIFVFTCYGLFSLMPLDMASAIGGFFGRVVGPRLKRHQIALENIGIALPELSPVQREKAIIKMWDNLGRIMAEYPHLRKFRYHGSGPRVQLEGTEYTKALKESGRPGIFIGAHYGNWELTATAVENLGAKLIVTYRPPNNPWVDWLLARARRHVASGQIAKGGPGLKEIMDLLESGGNIGFMVDQRTPAGIAVPFFGIPTLTAPTLVSLAYKYNAVIVPGYVRRIKGSYFKVVGLPPLELPRTGDEKADVLTVLTRMNAMLEDWIRESPDQWMWIYRRWKTTRQRR